MRLLTASILESLPWSRQAQVNGLFGQTIRPVIGAERIIDASNNRKKARLNFGFARELPRNTSCPSIENVPRTKFAAMAHIGTRESKQTR